MTIEVEILARRDGEVRCVFCRGELTGGIETCPGCRATFHPACRAEMSRCATIGCSGVRGEEGSSARRRPPRGSTAEVARRRPSAATPDRSVEADPDDSPALDRARTHEQFMRWSAVGAVVGVLIGLCGAYADSRHGIEVGPALRLGGLGLMLGAVEGVFIGAVGVRRKPFFSGKGKNNPTTVVQMMLFAPCGAAGAVIAEHFHVNPFVGGVAAFLLVLPWLLRWLGMG